MKRIQNSRLYCYPWKMVMLALLLGFCCSIKSSAQDKVEQLTDSLFREIENTPESHHIDILNELSKLYRTVSFETSIQYATQALEIAERLEDQNGIADSYNSIGVAYATLEIYDDAIPYFEKARDLRNAIHNRKGLVQSLNNLGIAYFHTGNSEKSLLCFEDAVNISLEIKNDTLLAASYHNLGELNSNLGNLDHAASLLDIAEGYYQQSGNFVKRVEVLNTLGSVYLQSGNLEKALENFRLSREECIRFNLLKELAFAENQIGRISMENGDLANSSIFFRSSLENARTSDDKAAISDAYLSLSDYYLKSGDLQQAFAYRTLSSEYKDTLFAQSIEQKLITLQKQYNIGIKDQELQLLRKNEELEKLKIQKTRYYKNFVIVLIFILVTFSSISLYNLSQARKSNTILEKQKRLQEETNLQLVGSKKVQQNINLTKNKIFTVLAENLITPFNLLLEYTEMLEQNADESNTKAIKKNSGIIYQSSKKLFQLLENLLQWSRNQRGIIEFHPGYFDLYKTMNHLISVEEVPAHKKSIELKPDLQEALIVYADESHIITVIKNLVSNAIKFSHIGGWVKISIRDKNDFAEVAITDNGIGINPEDMEKLFRMDTHITRKGTANEQGTGLGLIIAHELILKNRGSIYVESEEGMGSRFAFTIPKAPAESTKKSPDNHEKDGKQ